MTTPNAVSPHVTMINLERLGNIHHCCGGWRWKAFCPRCGKKLAPTHPLGSLLVHVRHQALSYLSRVERAYARGNARCINHAIPSLSKWLAWELALEEALGIEREEDTDDEA